MLLARTVDDLVLLLPDAMHVFLAVWLFAVGGCVGSFMNVVVLRMPAGIGIARSGSRCPVCLHPIRWYDNIPLISWLVLRGRCRDCGTSISLRYPFVELLIATMFLVLGLGEGLSSGGNLPFPSAPVDRLEPYQYWSIYAYHIILLVTLATATLIVRDGNPVPPSVFVPALLIGAIAPFFLPELHPVAFSTPEAGSSGLTSLSVGAVGLLTGVVLGLVIWPVTSLPRAPKRAWQVSMAACALTGLYLGSQAVATIVVMVALAFLAVSLAVRVLPNFRRVRWSAGPWTAYLILGGIFFIISWRMLVDRFPALGPRDRFLPSPCR